MQSIARDAGRSVLAHVLSVDDNRQL